MDTKTMIDFIVASAHDDKLRKDFLKAVKAANSAEYFMKWFKRFRKGEYHVTDDECTRLYENKQRILNNPYVTDPKVKGY